MSIENTLGPYTNAWNSKDVSTISGLICTDDNYHESSGSDNLGRIRKGAESVRAAISAKVSMFPDGRIIHAALVVVTSKHEDSEWDFEFPNKSGTTLRGNVVDIFAFDDDLIKHTNAILKQSVAAA